MFAVNKVQENAKGSLCCSSQKITTPEEARARRSRLIAAHAERMKSQSCRDLDNTRPAAKHSPSDVGFTRSDMMRRQSRSLPMLFVDIKRRREYADDESTATGSSKGQQQERQYLFARRNKRSAAQPNQFAQASRKELMIRAIMEENRRLSARSLKQQSEKSGTKSRLQRFFLKQTKSVFRNGDDDDAETISRSSYGSKREIDQAPFFGRYKNHSNLYV